MARASAAAPGVHIVRAAPEHLSALPEIERSAARRFAPEDVPPALAAEATPLETLEGACREQRLWVALGADGAPVGFALVAIVDGQPHLEEIDVRPEDAGRGIGRALIEAVCEAARAEGHRALTLTTFSHVPWNGPFYARAGFRVLAPSQLGPGLAARLAAEAQRGLDPARRVAMRRALG